MHRTGIFIGILHAFAMFFTLGSALLIGCVLDFLKHPLSWIADFWLPALLIGAGIISFAREELSRPVRHRHYGVWK